MDALITSTLIVTLAEIGDKTQLLAIVLATRFQRPIPIIAGIFAATVANHFLAALLGSEVASILDDDWFSYLVAASFIVMAGWTLIPDKLDDEDQKTARFGAFLTTLIAFFLVEMGDKTQVATVALGAQFNTVLMVTMGTTLGMMIANIPAIFLGHKLMQYVPLTTVRMIASGLFFLIGIWIIVQTAAL